MPLNDGVPVRREVATSGWDRFESQCLAGHPAADRAVWAWSSGDNGLESAQQG